VEKPDIAVIFEENIPNDSFKRFEAEVKDDNLNVVVKSRESSGPMACSEWHFLTNIAVFIASSYFLGFLQEMGKDHCQLLKKKLVKLDE